MNSKGTSHLITIFLCISFLFVFFQCTSSQPVSASLLKANMNNDDNGKVNAAGSLWIRPLSYSDSDELSTEDKNSEELSQLLPKYLIYNEHDENNQPSSSSLVRRANFWKRANFWRKRANFWRRDLAA